MNKNYAFFALISRMKNIDRWNLMRNANRENLMEHSFDVAVLAHALATIGVVYFNSEVDPDRVATVALFHDCSEIITGDMPTPIKVRNPGLREVYKEIEKNAQSLLCDMLPAELSPRYHELFEFSPTSPEYRFVKAADKLGAYLKCIAERLSGNGDFLSAERELKEMLSELKMPELDYFMKNFAPHYGKNLDELTK